MKSQPGVKCELKIGGGKKDKNQFRYGFSWIRTNISQFSTVTLYFSQRLRPLNARHNNLFPAFVLCALPLSYEPDQLWEFRLY